MKNTEQPFDAEELLHLAMEASKNSDNETAIKHLKSALEISPDSAEVHFMLGSTYADIGMYERAENSLKQALVAKPDFEAARFQLGLLYIVNNQVDQASTTWEALDNLGDDNPHYLFKCGLLHLAKDEFDKSIEYINKGLVANTQNTPLNNNMNQILNDILAVQQQTSGVAAPANNLNNAKHAQLKAYEDTED